MKNGKIRVAFGIVLLVLQLVAVLAIGPSSIKLWNNGTDADPAISAEPSYLTPSQWIFGLSVGMEKLSSVYDELFTDSAYNYHTLTTKEYASAHVRESLLDGGALAQIMLFLYDLNILIGFLTYGITGAVLVIVGGRAGAAPKPVRSGLDENNTSIRVTSIILSVLGVLASLNDSSVAWISFGFLLAFFIGRFGKHRSVLIPSAMILFAIEALSNAMGDFAALPSAESDEVLWVCVSIVLVLTYGGIYLYCGIQLYRDAPKKKFKLLSIVAAVAAVINAMIWPAVLAMGDVGVFLFFLDYGTILYALLTVLYICVAKTQPEAPVSAVELSGFARARLVPSPDCCRFCGEKLNTGRSHCMKCGTPVSMPTPTPVVPVQEMTPAQPEQTPSPAAAVPQQPRVRCCHVCEKTLLPGAAFCVNCGTKIPEQPKTPARPRFCRICGSALLPEGVFCTNCGTKIV